ncbi:MAG: class II glutamine amidotransferase, partial [Bdellovibrionales bacterium]|nr:class II glutamine amidotransferase [Bdellovibrionales bacterium]
IVRALSDESFTWLQGQTDSQHLFALFLDEIKVESNAVGKFKILTALQKTISRINAWSKAAGITEPSTLNLAVTDGQSLVATRYVNRLDAKANTLYYSAGNSYECHDGVCMMKRTNPEDSCVLVVSEKLTDIRNDWNEVAVNHAVLVDEDLKVSIAPLNLDSKSQ